MKRSGPLEENLLGVRERSLSHRAWVSGFRREGFKGVPSGHPAYEISALGTWGRPKNMSDGDHGGPMPSVPVQLSVRAPALS